MKSRVQSPESTGKERPILFSGEMVRAILEGKKTQTRRVVKIGSPKSDAKSPKFLDREEISFRHYCPYGSMGDRIWVRETFTLNNDGAWCYRASESLPTNRKWVPSIHMPRKASRISLEITGVRVERLQEISAKDAEAEGIEVYPNGKHSLYLDYLHREEMGIVQSAQHSYQTLWESINGKGSWGKNPWVWVIEFKRFELAATGTPSGAQVAVPGGDL